MTCKSNVYTPKLLHSFQLAKLNDYMFIHAKILKIFIHSNISQKKYYFCK